MSVFLHYGATDPSEDEVKEPVSESAAPVVAPASADETEEEETWSDYFKRIFGITAVQQGSIKLAKNAKRSARNLQASTCVPAVRAELKEIAELPEVTKDIVAEREQTYQDRVIEL